MSRPDPRIAEQIAYYRAIAPDYADGALELPGGEELEHAVERFRPSGRVLELACGPGTWTAQLLRWADSLTAVDSSPEMLAQAVRRVPAGSVRFVLSDIFGWQPDGLYDVVFFGFWLSHVPDARFEEYFALVARCLAPGGRMLFLDDAHRTPQELVEGEASEMIERRTRDGAAFRIVKVAHDPDVLAARLAALGWRIDVHRTAGPFFHGSGTPAD